MQEVFLSLRVNKCLQRVNHDQQFWNLGVFSYAMIPRCQPNLTVFFSMSHLQFDANSLIQVFLGNSIQEIEMAAVVFH